MKHSHYDIIQYPHITEKATLLSEQGKYIFKVKKDACKESFKAAIENIFKVKVEKVNVMVCKGKTKVFKGKPGKRQDFKKMIVTLEKGQTIDLAAEV